MILTRTDTGASLTLSDDYAWPERYNWSPVSQSQTVLFSGSLLVQEARQLAGRPITLQPSDDAGPWLTTAEVETLRSWAAVAQLALTLTLGGATYNVAWRHTDGAIEARPVAWIAGLATDVPLWLVTLRFTCLDAA